ncbi:hypothetical protein KR018_010362, partial [Drosophila ironensis]
YLVTMIMDDILSDALREEDFNLKQSDSSVRGSLSQMLSPQVSTDLDQAIDQDVDMDPRLRNWNRTLAQRRRIQKRIERQTGKRAEEVLFNRNTSIDEPGKQMILRILDSADRTRRTTRIKGEAEMISLKPRHDPELCRDINELFITKPVPQRIEFVGLSQVAQKEVANTQLPPEAAESRWLQSKVLADRLEAKKKLIQEVLQFAPDIEKLQVTSAIKAVPSEGPRIVKMGTHELLPLSESSSDAEEDKEDRESEPEPCYDCEDDSGVHSVVDSVMEVVPTSQPFEVEVDDVEESAIIVNGRLYDYDNANRSASKAIRLDLCCNPYERVVDTLLDVQNLSKGLLNINWVAKNRSRNDIPVLDSELIFDRSEFILEPGGRRVVRAMFQPLVVGVYTLRFALFFVRSPFCGTRRIDVILQGKCTMPDLYAYRLQRHQQISLDKHRENQAKKLVNIHANLAPLIENPPLLCPYERALDERELFNAQNINYRCERYDDLEALKDIYHRAKKARDRPWDLSLVSLRRMINKQESLQMRVSLNGELAELLPTMVCNRCEALHLLEHNPERERSCFIYVRGIVCSALERWEKMVFYLDDQFFKMEILRCLDQQATGLEATGLEATGLEEKTVATDETGQSAMYDNNEKSNKPVLTEEEIVILVSKKLKKSKYFRDALYMHTYNLLCDVAEDMVSVIESTVS